ncbi:MAG: DUF370 domain-containing protein [Clostridia bacterium]|nr:DUF370 domain-containing protein [Clostridia bacterium]
MQLVNVGYGNMVAVNRLLAVVSPDSSPVRRLVQEVREQKKVIDVTMGRRTRSVLIMDSGHIVLSPLSSETLAARVEQQGKQEALQAPVLEEQAARMPE